MRYQRFALFSPEEGESGSGAAGGDHEGDDEPKDVVPKSQFLAALKSAEDKREREVAALRSEFDAKLADATKPKVEAPKVYTRADLKVMVDAGQITAEQADEQIEFQISQRAAQVARDTVHQETQKGTVDSQLAEYKALAPELLNTGSEVYQKVKVEYDFLRSTGDPRNVVTELKAIRAALGPLDKLRAAKAGRTSHESTPELGGEGGEGRRSGEGSLKLSAKERKHYEKGIETGRYKDWKAVADELKFANPNTRRKHGAPA